MPTLTTDQRIALPERAVAGLPRDAMAAGAGGGTIESAKSAVSWAAILGGAAAAAALALILLVLGSGLGFSAVSPWSGHGAQASTLGAAAIAWLAFTQIVSAGMGGYLAGRLRVKWSGVHDDEIYFRDTAHGFLAWATATLVSAALLSSAVGSIVSGAADLAAGTAAVAAPAAAGAAAQSQPGTAPRLTSAMPGQDYAIDAMFRASPSSAVAGDNVPRTEVAGIIGNALRNGSLGDDDKRYLAQLVARHTGLTEADAQKRVGDAYSRLTTSIADAETKARQAADTARKNAAYAALWMFVALLAGAFCASLGATAGGRQRDR